MIWRRPRLALILLGDRLVAGAVRGSQLETFAVATSSFRVTLLVRSGDVAESVRTLWGLL